MSRPDLLTELRAARPAAPPELRERVLALAPAAPPRHRRLSWRLGVVIAFAAGFAVVAAVVATRGGRDHTAATTTPAIVRGRPSTDSSGNAHETLGAPANAKTFSATVPAPAPGRVQRYRAYVELRVENASDVSEASQRAQSITRSLGGYVLAVTVDARGKKGSAELTLRVPRQHVQEAVARLSQLGTVIAENVQVQDLQAQVNANDRLIERLQKRLADLRAKEQTDEVKRQVAALTKRIQQLQRTRATTVREAHYATVELQVTTKKAAAAKPDEGPGPLHGLGVAFRWIGIGAVYALALGTPFVVLLVLLWLAARAVRRRREEALLSSP
jgi:hypothetical protein